MHSARTSQLRKGTRRAGERGQAAVFLVLALGIFLIGGVGFVVDGANLWFHRQAAQTAADAACTAAAMNLLSQASGVMPPDPDWISQGTTAFTCDDSMDDSGGNSQGNRGLPPCGYAALNGYSGSLKSVQVQLSDALVDGKGNPVVPQCNSVYSAQVCSADTFDGNAFVKTSYATIELTDNVQMTFSRMLGMGPTAGVAAQARCGLSNVLSAVPLLVLNPNAPHAPLSNALTADPGAHLIVFNGPQNSIQVNSIDPNDSTGQGAVDLSSANVDLTEANNGNGGSFSVAARESKGAANGDRVSFGTNGQWVNAGGTMSDPFATIPAPNPLQLPPGSVTPTHNCPGINKSGIVCDLYSPGYYSTGICVKKTPPGPPCPGMSGASGLAVFQPGIYYLNGDFVADSRSCLRPGDSSLSIGGTIFYFSGTHTLRVTSNSGQLRQMSSGFNCQTDGVDLSTIPCISNVPSGVTTLYGNVLLGPCTGPYGDPTGAGERRGVLFFQDRSSQPASQPTWDPVAAFGLVGNIYFHNCSSGTTAGSGANCDPGAAGAFADTVYIGNSPWLFGTPTTHAYIIGDVVTDQLYLGPTTTPIALSLSARREYYVLKASLLQ